jgi:phosphocarrier protein HPr
VQEKVFTIIEKAGIHARPASELVRLVSQFQSEVMIEYGDKTANLKSILGLMSLGIKEGAAVKIRANGVDEDDVMVKLGAFLEQSHLAK